MSGAHSPASPVESETAGGLITLSYRASDAVENAIAQVLLVTDLDIARSDDVLDCKLRKACVKTLFSTLNQSHHLISNHSLWRLRPCTYPPKPPLRGVQVNTDACTAVLDAAFH